jgi:nucleoside-diphosphate-sugar epimerase
MTDLVLLTGISGFLGLHVAREFLARGYAVRGSVRDLAKTKSIEVCLRAAGVDISSLSFVELDLEYDRNWAAAVEGCRYVVHTASPFVTRMPDDAEDLIRPAVDGTARAIRAALGANVERIVLTSSMVAMSHGHGKSPPAIYTAADWTNLENRSVNAYDQSKTMAERRAWALMQAAGREQDLTTINPGTLLGPRLSDDLGTSVALIPRLLAGEMPAVPRISLVYADVRDAAELHAIAVCAPEAYGQRVPVGFKSSYISDIARLLRERFPDQAARVPRLVMPDWCTRLYAQFNPEIAANRDIIGVQQVLDPHPAQLLLGRRLRTVEEALEASVQSLIARGLV